MLKLEVKLSLGSAITFFSSNFPEKKLKKKVKHNILFPILNYAALPKSLETNYSNRSLLSPMLKDKSCPCSGRTAPGRGGKLCKLCLCPALQNTGEKMVPSASHLLPSHLHPAPMLSLTLQCQSRKVQYSFQLPSLLIKSYFNRFTMINLTSIREM